MFASNLTVTTDVIMSAFVSQYPDFKNFFKDAIWVQLPAPSHSDKADCVFAAQSDNNLIALVWISEDGITSQVRTTCK